MKTILCTIGILSVLITSNAVATDKREHSKGGEPIQERNPITVGHSAECGTVGTVSPLAGLQSVLNDEFGGMLISTETESLWTRRFADDFEDRDAIGENYTTARGMEDAWKVVDGVLIGKQTNDDHGAVIRTEMDFSDGDITFDFRFSGGKSFNFVIDDKNERTVHAGHICRVSIFPKRLIIRDDKTGAMNLDVRERRKRDDLGEQEAKRLRELLSATQSSAKVDIKPGEWHQLRVRIEGDVMKAFLDGEEATRLQSPGLAHLTKTKFGFTVNGSTIDFDNLTVLMPERQIR